MTTTNKKQFLTQELPNLLKQLKADTSPHFGLMTAQHMIEHLTYSIKYSIKRVGEPDNPPTPKQLGFQKFIAKGAILQHRPSDKTKDDLPTLKYPSLEDAVKEIYVAVHRFYHHFEANPMAKSYNPFFGELGFEQLESFNYQHLRYHFWQFGLLKTYP